MEPIFWSQENRYATQRRQIIGFQYAHSEPDTIEKDFDHPDLAEKEYGLTLLRQRLCHMHIFTLTHEFNYSQFVVIWKFHDQSIIP